MPKFLATYMASSEGSADFEWTDEFSRSFMSAWGEWGKRHKAVIVDGGTPIGKTKRIDSNGISDMKNMITGYVIVEAESHADAAKMFEGHPHASMLPGTWIEIMECLDMPQI
jgi:hypothetical protein